LKVEEAVNFATLATEAGLFLSKKRNCTKVQIFGWKRYAKKKKRSATMQHSAKTLCHIRFKEIIYQEA